MDNTNFIILLLLIFLAIAIYNMYKLNRTRIEWRTRLGYLITCILRDKIPDKNKLKDLENLNNSIMTKNHDTYRKKHSYFNKQ